MSDLFHEDVPDEYICLAAQVMEVGNWHTYQVLTKRSERMRDLLGSKLQFAGHLPHILWGVSVENKKHGLPRIDNLRKAPVTVRFLSIEPLMEDLGPISLNGISWVIVGGESGHGARLMDVAWVLSIRDQYRRAGVPFIFKQWGGSTKKRAGRTLEGRTYDEMPTRVQHPVPKRERCLELIAEIEAGWLVHHQRKAADRQASARRIGDEGCVGRTAQVVSPRFE
jgi:protein gp37